MNVDDQLYRRVKVRAAEEGTTVTSLVEQTLEIMLATRGTAPATARFRVPVMPSAGGLLPGVASPATRRSRIFSMPTCGRKS